MLDLKPKLNTRALRVKMAENDIFTMTELASMLGVTKSAVSIWVNGESFPSDDNLISLAGALNCQVTDLVILPKSIALPQMTQAAPLMTAQA
jgi:transcriptional regulator with XRE-family HTH domain